MSNLDQFNRAMLEDTLSGISLDETLAKKLKIAIEEFNSSQYQEAASHFDDLYIASPDVYLFSFLRTVCKCHTGTRGNVVSDAGKLGAIFSSTLEKILKESAPVRKTLLPLTLGIYYQTMMLLYDNAVDNSNSVTVGRDCFETFRAFVTACADEITDDNAELVSIVDYICTEGLTDNHQKIWGKERILEIVPTVCASSERIRKSRREDVGTLIDLGHCDEALALYAVLNDGEECLYKKASGLLESGKYESAEEIFKAIPEYGDSAERIKECQYGHAKELFEKKSWWMAKVAFDALGQYKDSADFLPRCEENMERERKAEAAENRTRTISIIALVAGVMAVVTGLSVGVPWISLVGLPIAIVAGVIYAKLNC